MSDDTRKKGTDDKPVVDVQRRRRTEQTGRERAEAPRRQGRESQQRAAPEPGRTGTTGRPASSWGGTRPPSTSGRPTAGLPLPAMSGRTLLLLLGAVAVLVVCGLLAMLLLGGGGGDGADTGDLGGGVPTEDLGFVPTEPAWEEPTAVPSGPTEVPTPFVAPTVSAEGQTWLVMLYQDADDKVLEKDIYVDLNEAERVGSNERVQIVAQVDRYAGGFDGDGNWVSAKRFYVTRDDDLTRVGSRLVADLGEANMADAKTLVDFATWAIQTFPADRHVLILSDHGMGWPGGWSDPAPGGRGDSRIPLTSRLGDQLFLMEIDDALQAIRSQTGVDRLEMIGMDACLMGHLEVLSALAPHARTAVVSQETEPALGWAYASFLSALQRNPDMSGAELGQLIVDSYIQEDQRIVDDEARADLLRQGSPMGGLFGLMTTPSAGEVARQMSQGITLAAVDLSAVPALMDSFNALAFALQAESQPEVARARTRAQSFTSIFGQEVPPSYIDLGHFVQLLKQARLGSAAAQAADEVLASLQRAVVAEKHGPGKPGATGVSIYFPNSELFRSPLTGPQSYTAIARRFAGDSVWDDFLAFHYTGRRFEEAERQPAVPEEGASVSAPGAGQIEIRNLRLSSEVAAPGEPATLTADIRGTNLGYVQFFTGYYDRESNSIFVADLDYLESEDTRELSGVYYPVWPEGEFTLRFVWEPLMFAISDGSESVTALLTPVSYGASPDQAVYTVEGIYTFAGGESRYARLYLRDGRLRQVYGYTGQDGSGAPREILPETGDTFTILEKWLDLDAQGRVQQVSRQQGGTLTFGDQMFEWQELDAAVGEYVIGLFVEDLDGKRTEAYATITVE